MIYFISFAEVRAVKIGYATDPLARLKDLQCAAPYELRIVGAIPGDRRLEHRVHLLIGTLYGGLFGEWFEEAPALEFLAAYQADPVNVWREYEDRIAVRRAKVMATAEFASKQLKHAGLQKTHAIYAAAQTNPQFRQWLYDTAAGDLRPIPASASLNLFTAEQAPFRAQA